MYFYLVSVLLLLLVIPAGCVIVEAIVSHGPIDLMFLIGKWFVFWAAGVRLFIAGGRQVFQPQYTAMKIFEIADPGAASIVRELGFANLAMGTLALASLGNSAWLVPAAIVGGLYYGLAGAGHVVRAKKNPLEQIALYSDLFIFLLIAAFVVSRAI